MSVILSPLPPRYAVLEADDPFKKYWWAILLGIACTAVWLLTPILGEKSIGSAAIDTTKPPADANVEQSLAADAGGGVDLSMDGTGRRRKEDGPPVSSLYQAPPEEPAAAAGAAGSGSTEGSTLASALKKVSEGSGGWGEKAQRGFNAPKLAGGSLSGLGAAGGGSAGSASGTSAFGSNNARVGFADAKGFSGGGQGEETPNSKGLTALKAASAQAQLAAASGSNDAARTSLSQAFDGARGANRIGGGAGGALAGTYAALDAAPVNLKLSDPKLNEKKLEAPPAADVGQSDMQDSDMAKQIAMQLAGAVLGAVIGGPVGGAVVQVVMQTVQRQADQQEKIRQMGEQQRLDRAARNMGARTGGS